METILSTLVKKLYSLSHLDKYSVKTFVVGIVFILPLLGCEPNSSPKPPDTNPADLVAKGEAAELIFTLEALLKTDEKTVSSTKECPQKLIETLPEAARCAETLTDAFPRNIYKNQNCHQIWQH